MKNHNCNIIFFLSIYFLKFIFLQITHTLSVSLNKIGDLKYYDEDLQAARSYYFKSLNVRRDVVKHNSNVPSQVGYYYLHTFDLNFLMLMFN